MYTDGSISSWQSYGGSYTGCEDHGDAAAFSFPAQKQWQCLAELTDKVLLNLTKTNRFCCSIDKFSSGCTTTSLSVFSTRGEFYGRAPTSFSNNYIANGETARSTENRSTEWKIRRLKIKFSTPRPAPRWLSIKHSRRAIKSRPRASEIMRDLRVFRCKLTGR